MQNRTYTTYRSYRSYSSYAVIAVLALAIYAQTFSFDFVLFDDDAYVFDNPLVAGGLTAGAVAHAFRFRAANWHPLTWLSHAADVSLFGMTPGRHHLVNVLLHIAAALLLVLALERLTGDRVRSAIVGAWFAVHPLNVENVAWVSERKTLLATLFVFAGLYLYARRARMAWVIAAHALAVMAKPTAVVFPVLLVLLDQWPLRRGWKLAEKIPFVAISAVSAVLTFLAQKSGGAVVDTIRVPLDQRLANAAASTLWYLGKAVCPSNLSFFYPHPGSIPVALAIGAAAVIAIVTVLSWRAPHVFTGWMWFLAALLPVIGIVQVGAQARADRYAYLPLVGIFIAIVWSVPRMSRVAIAAAAMSVVALAVTAHHQTRIWRDSRTLFSYGIQQNPRNWIAWGDLGLVLLNDERLDEAAFCFERALALNANDPNATFNIGYVRSLQGRYAEAGTWYRRTLAQRPADARALEALRLTELDLAR